MIIKKYKTNENGITMVALILMIILMLILATVSVSIISGTDGVVKNTEKIINLAEQDSLNEKIKEEIKKEEIKAKLLGQEVSNETIINIIDQHGGDYDYQIPITLDNQGATITGTVKIYEIYNKNFAIYKNNKFEVMTNVTNRIEFPEKYDTDGSYMLFMGYYTEPEGQGVKYINEEGYLTDNRYKPEQEAADPTHFITDGTLYAYWRRLPEEYQELAFIELNTIDTKPYFDTNFTPNKDTKVEMKFQVPVSTGYGLFGSRTSSSSKGYTFQNVSTNKRWGGMYGDSVKQSDISSQNNDIHTVMRDKNVLILDNENIYTYGTGFNNCDYEMYLLNVNEKGSPFANIPKETKLFYCRVYDNGTLIRAFIPCKSKGIVYDVDGTQCAADTIGLFETKDRKFYINKGTGTFIAGDIVDDN